MKSSTYDFDIKSQNLYKDIMKTLKIINSFKKQFKTSESRFDKPNIPIPMKKPKIDSKT
jgi:hypothetical protein